MKALKGFTVIELLITLSIFSILLSYSIPSLHQLKLSILIDEERSRLTSSLMYSRNQAISSSESIIVCPSQSGSACDSQSNWYQGWIVFSDTNKDRKFNGDDKLLLVEDAMRKEITATSSINRQKIRYNSLGFSPGTNVSINFCDERGSKFAISIIINNAGRVKQSKPISENVCN